MSLPGRLGGKRLTEELRKLAVEVHTVLDDGTPVTREQALADLVWKYALGWTDASRDIEGNLQQIKHPPVAWAMQYLFERMEGRAPNAQPEAEGGIRATDKVRELVKNRLNALVGVTPKPLGPPPHKPRDLT